MLNMLNMGSSEGANISVIVVAPRSLLHSVAAQLLSQKSGVIPAKDQPPTTEDGSDLTQIILDALSLGNLEQLSRLMEQLRVSILLFSEEDSFRALSGREGLSVEKLSRPPGGDEELYNAVLSTIGAHQLLGSSRELAIGTGIEGLLSTREREVLALLAEGASNKQISKDLSITANTVYTHVRHIQGKLRTSNRTETALLARTMLGQVRSGVYAGS